MNSLQLILSLSPKVIYPGHGPVIENPREAIEHYLSHRQQRNEQILDALKQSNGGLDPEQITRVVYKVTFEGERIHFVEDDDTEDTVHFSRVNSI